ncbi:hypothetical protein DFH06DRAFT_1348521 [Mycena polygramma]|nr:hypothetical protein DFH06DRAFT_1348521 [Mycena polygramma]
MAAPPSAPNLASPSRTDDGGQHAHSTPLPSTIVPPVVPGAATAPDTHPDPATAARYAVFARRHDIRGPYPLPKPTLHDHAHQKQCTVRSRSNTDTDGETVERGWHTGPVVRVDSERICQAWSEANPLASSTRQMPPGQRQDLFAPDAFNHWNKKKNMEISLQMDTSLQTDI